MSEASSPNGKNSKRKQAVALKYAEGDKAPKVVATGAGEIAKRILELAQENDVPIRQDDSLVDILSKLDLGYEIPPETFRVVAEILAFLYRTDEAWRKEREHLAEAELSDSGLDTIAIEGDISDSSTVTDSSSSSLLAPSKKNR